MMCGETIWLRTRGLLVWSDGTNLTIKSDEQVNRFSFNPAGAGSAIRALDAQIRDLQAAQETLAAMITEMGDHS